MTPGAPSEPNWKGTPMTYGGGMWYSGRGRAPDPTMRVSDEERNKVAEALSQHYSEGRLDANELKERLDKAIGAKTRGDLSGLMVDLPQLRPTVPEPHRRRRHVALWVTLFVLLAAASFPWGAYHWYWFPRVPWLLVGIVALCAWGRGRRFRAYHHRQQTY